MGDLSCFVDESGTQEGKTDYYVVTFVLHDQADDILGCISGYEQSLRIKGIPDIPFHATPLLRAHDAYEHMSIEERKGLLVAFSLLVKRLPIRYRSFVYRSSEFDNERKLQGAHPSRPRSNACGSPGLLPILRACKDLL